FGMFWGEWPAARRHVTGRRGENIPKRGCIPALQTLAGAPVCDTLKPSGTVPTHPRERTRWPRTHAPGRVAELFRRGLRPGAAAGGAVPARAQPRPPLRRPGRRLRRLRRALRLPLPLRQPRAADQPAALAAVPGLDPRRVLPLRRVPPAAHALGPVRAAGR